jgi:hypothetical protein
MAIENKTIHELPAIASPDGSEEMAVYDGSNMGRVTITQVATFGGGDVTGPGESTDNAVVRWNGTGGDTLQDSDVTIDDDGSIVATGYLITDKAVASNTDGSTRRIVNPGGGGYYAEGNVTGAIRIKLPASVYSVSAMVKFRVSVYNYTNEESFDVFIAGFARDSANTWLATTAYIVAQPGTSRDFTVRFGKDGTNRIVWIGETTGGWAFPGVHITDVQTSYSDYSNTGWFDNWSVDLATSFDTVEATITDTQIVSA